MADFIGGIFGLAFILGLFWLYAFIMNPDETKVFTKKFLQKAKKGTIKTMDYTNQNTSKVRDYAIIVVCIVAIIALIAFFAR